MVRGFCISSFPYLESSSRTSKMRLDEKALVSPKPPQIIQNHSTAFEITQDTQNHGPIVLMKSPQNQSQKFIQTHSTCVFFPLDVYGFSDPLILPLQNRGPAVILTMVLCLGMSDYKLSKNCGKKLSDFIEGHS